MTVRSDQVVGADGLDLPGGFVAQGGGDLVSVWVTVSSRVPKRIWAPSSTARSARIGSIRSWLAMAKPPGERWEVRGVLDDCVQRPPGEAPGDGDMQSHAAGRPSGAGPVGDTGYSQRLHRLRRLTACLRVNRGGAVLLHE
ncbi:MAG TPA: hypothetical protein VIY28_09975 [Pseudonocardiaceae bacterium]